MENEQNHYRILGVDENAGSDEIRHAYRTAARKHHPDTTSGDSAAFRRVQEAYEVLNDRDQRGAYDRDRHANDPRQAGGSSEIRHHRRRPVFDGFSETPFFGMFADPAFGSRELALEVLLSAGEAERGGRIPVEIPLSVECPRCRGWGCGACFGSGETEAAVEIALEYPPGIQNGSDMYFSLRRGVHETALHVTFFVTGRRTGRR